MELNIWGEVFIAGNLPDEVRRYLDALPEKMPSVEWVWKEMDRVWDECELDNSALLSNQDAGRFYGHPVWIMNGIFTALDPESKSHRVAIAKYIASENPKKVGDYGGGSGTLAAQITAYIRDVVVEIIEPYASDFFKSKHACERHIRYLDDFSDDDYDALIAQDVLEHIDNPIGVAFFISSHVREGGLVVFLNCFHPVIKCHLPSTFHLRYTFKYVMVKMGLEFVGSIPGADHAQVFRKIGPIDIYSAKRAERISKVLGPVINAGYLIARNIYRAIKK